MWEKEIVSYLSNRMKCLLLVIASLPRVLSSVEERRVMESSGTLQICFSLTES